MHKRFKKFLGILEDSLSNAVKEELPKEFVDTLKRLRTSLLLLGISMVVFSLGAVVALILLVLRLT